MKAFKNANARDARHAVSLARETRHDGRRSSFAGGGSDLLGMVKDQLVQPDVLVNLKTIRGADRVEASSRGVTIGGLISLDALSRDEGVLRHYTVLAEAAGSVATPQIRRVGTLAGNVCQRPWCWYFRNGFPCYKAGGNQCFSFAGENQFHAIFGGGPSYIVHPSDTAPALVALDAQFHTTGPAGERTVAAADFFSLPRQNPGGENVLADDEMLSGVEVPAAKAGTRSTYRKVLDRAAWTHAVVSVALVLEMQQDECRSARIVMGGVAPIPWRLREVEKLLAGQRITVTLADKAGELAVAGARPLAHNAYKVPLTRNLVRRTVLELATRA
jgi:xanthine dehydrogenase YagS FAD-binding subunit